MKFNDPALERAYTEILSRIDTELRMLFLAGYESALRDMREGRDPDAPVEVRAETG